MAVRSVSEEYSLRRLIFTALALFLLAGVLFASFRFISNPARGYTVFTDVAFASGTSSKMGRLTPKDWHTASNASEIRKDESDTYIYISGTMPDSIIGSLRIMGENATYSVSVDDQVIYDTLKGGANVSPSSYSDILLEGDYAGKSFDITAYVPFTDSITLLYSPDRPTTNPPYFIAAFVLALIAVLAFVFTHIRIKSFQKLSINDLLPMALLLCALVLFLRISSANIILLRIQMASNVAICLILLLFVLLSRSSWSENTEKLFSINMFYLAIVLFMPYNMLVVAILRLGILLQGVNVLFLIVKAVKSHGPRLDQTMPIAVVFFASDLYFWYCLAAGDLSDSLMFLIGATCVDILYFWSSQLWKARRRNTMQHTEGLAGIALSEEAATAMDAAPADEKNHEIETLPMYTSQKLSEVSMRYAGFACEHVQAVILALINSKGTGENGHALRVAEYTRLLCLAMGMSETKANTIADATLLHDIGKLAVSSDILDKPNPTKEEIAEIRRHNEYGYRMLCGNSDPFLALVANVVHEHHEHVDGSGYIGLKGNEICLPARIATVADVFDALTSYRPYKKTWSFEEACNYLIENSGTYFDEAVVKSFIGAEQSMRAVHEIYRQKNTTVYKAVETEKT